MNIVTRYQNHPEDVMLYTTEDLRKHFLVEDFFVPDEVNLTYWHYDRMITGGIMPKAHSLTLAPCKEISADWFFGRREGGIINIGGVGKISIDGVKIEIDPFEGLYIGRGVKEITFAAANALVPPKFVLMSAPAHNDWPTKLITQDMVNEQSIGDVSTGSKRTVVKYVHPEVVKSCQLVMGLIEVELGSVWSVMPVHTHERRSEAYLYFDMGEDTRVFHIMGEAGQTRHIVAANEQMVLAPGWSVHTGCGTGKYSLIWCTCGESKELADIDLVPMGGLR